MGQSGLWNVPTQMCNQIVGDQVVKVPCSDSTDHVPKPTDMDTPLIWSDHVNQGPDGSTQVIVQHEPVADFGFWFHASPVNAVLTVVVLTLALVTVTRIAWAAFKALTYAALQERPKGKR